MKIKDGCKGCDKYWYTVTPPEGTPKEKIGREGQCSTCKRCLNCCGDERVEYSCAWRSMRLKRSNYQGYLRSKSASDRYHENGNVLKGYRKHV